VQAASTSIHGPHGQFIENIHLEPYTSEEHFWDLYKKRYSMLFDKAASFLAATGGGNARDDDVAVFISCARGSTRA
jgi:histone deacetylase HOS3